MDWNLYTTAHTAERLYYEHLCSIYRPPDRDAALLDPSRNGALARPGSLLRSLYDHRNHALECWHNHVANILIKERVE